MANPFELMKKGMSALPPVKGKKGVKEEAKAEGEPVPFEKKEKKAGDKDDAGKKGKFPFPFKKKGKC